MPNEPIRADTLRVAGRYYEELNKHLTSCGPECNYNCIDISNGWGGEFVYDEVFIDIYRYIAPLYQFSRGSSGSKNGTVAYNNLITSQNHKQYFGTDFPSYYFESP